MSVWGTTVRVINTLIGIGVSIAILDGVRGRFVDPIEVMNERRVMDRDPPIYKPGEVVIYKNKVRNKEDCEIEITRMLISADGAIRYRAAQETRIVRGDYQVVDNVNRVPLPSPLVDGKYGIHTFARFHCTALDEFFGRYTFSPPLPIETKN